MLKYGICVYLNSIFGSHEVGHAEVDGGILKIEIKDLYNVLISWCREKKCMDDITPYYDQLEKEVDKKDGTERCLKFKPIEYKVVES